MLNAALALFGGLMMRWSLAICKDMHFAAMGRDYAELGAQALLGRMPAALPGTTLYTRSGDLFGWLCTAAALTLACFGRRRWIGLVYAKSASSTIR